MLEGVRIAVVIPALNEEETLPGVIARIPGWIDRIIVVDNGSRDRTSQVARDAGAHVVSEPRAGYGRACQAGIREVLTEHASPADVLVFLDADGSDAPEQMEALVRPIVEGRADFVVGSRTRGNVARGALTPQQRLGNALATTLIRWIWGEQWSDLGPFRAVRSSSLRALSMDDETYGWTVQMQIRAARVGLRSREVPVDYACRRGGKSKISGTARGVLLAGMKILSCVASEALRRTSPSPRKETLAIFARFPTPGQAKTRLIPALGAAGAANLYEEMVMGTIGSVQELLARRRVDARVWTAGCVPAELERLIEGRVPCVAQSEGDLGRRMDDAFRSMLRDSDAAVIIGTDCPDLSASILTMAFDLLASSDIVIGPASDGGYYLIGLTRPIPSLFEGVGWGTDTVLATTLDRARSLGLSVAFLPMLRDVDRPEDLDVWHRAKAARAGATSQLSVIIPALNERDRIGDLIDSLRRPGAEIIVADGGSEDGTLDVAAEHGARVISATRGRGMQLNAGAACATSDRLLFLHADTKPPPDYVEIVLNTLDDPRVSIGAFRFKLDRRSPMLRLVEFAVRARCTVLGSPYGDQGLFMRRETFDRLGGFAPIPLMEDVDLVRRTRRMGRVAMDRSAAVTSSRRWAAAGPLRMTFINQVCLLGFALGVPPERLAHWRTRASSRGLARSSRKEPNPSSSDGARRRSRPHGSPRQLHRRLGPGRQEVDEAVAAPDEDLGGT